MEGKKRKGYKTQEQQTQATKTYRGTEKGKKNTLRYNYKSNCKKFIREFADLEELKELETLIQKRKGEMKMEVKNLKDKNGYSYELYAVRGGDRFEVADLKEFARQNRVEHGIYDTEIIPETFYELEKMIEEINEYFKKRKQEKGWELFPCD